MTFANDVAACRPHLVRWANALTRNEAEVDDLVQDTMLRALTREHQFRPGTSMVHWLNTILWTIHANYRRSDKFRAGRNWEYYHAHQKRGMPNALDRIYLQDVLQELSRLRGYEILLRRAAGATYEELQEEFDIAAGTVKSRISRARDFIADMR